MGRDNFTFNPGDTQTIVMAQMMARGSNKNAVTKLKQLSDNVYNLKIRAELLLEFLIIHQK